MEHNLADGLAFNAKSRSSHNALIDARESLTYAQLDARVSLFAQHLLQRYPTPGAIIGICLEDHADHVAAMYACMRAGLVFLPVDWHWTAHEREAVISHFGAVCVITEKDIPISSCPSISCDLLHQPIDVDQCLAWPFTSLDTDLLISLSSGTTGRPKGPLISHRHFLRRFWTHWINLGLNANSRYICSTPLYFGGGRTFTLSVIFSGGTVILKPPPFQPQELAQLVQLTQANALFLVPTQLRRLLASDSHVQSAFHSLQLLLSSGAPLTPSERMQIKSQLCARFFEYYACTEGGGVTLSTPEDFDVHLTSVGRPVFGVEISIVDDNDVVLGAGEVGYLRFKGPGVATSFYEDPEESKKSFKEGWFYPGDMAVLDEQGYVFLRGRSKDIIIRGGLNIYPNEIEDVLKQLVDIDECAVFGVPDEQLGECVACAWVSHSSIFKEELIEHCKKYLSIYKIPQRWMKVNTMPRNSSGKIVKNQLKQILLKQVIKS